MVVPFRWLCLPGKTADTLKLNNPYTICIVYLGFGAGLAVFMFTGFVKGSPLEIEEAAMIDGCSPLQVFFKILIPILKPTIISTAILELMWVWNDYLLPTLVLDIKKYKTIPNGNPVFPWKLWSCADGTDDGKYYDRHYPDYCLYIWFARNILSRVLQPVLLRVRIVCGNPAEKCVCEAD